MGEETQKPGRFLLGLTLKLHQSPPVKSSPSIFVFTFDALPPIPPPSRCHAPDAITDMPPQSPLLHFNCHIEIQLQIQIQMQIIQIQKIQIQMQICYVVMVANGRCGWIFFSKCLWLTIHDP